jgi:molybdopterin-containing oxidoreductase family iron-sulfur binding subunit
MSHREHHHELEPVRAELRNKQGREFWRSLDELADTPRFREFLHREFPALNAPETDETLLDPSGRRSFMKVMGASLAFAGLTACTVQPREYAVPYVKNPEGVTPGKSSFFATAFTHNGVADGLLVEAHEGRPTKIEGNPDHPGSLGGTSLYAQASILNLYDPDRSQNVTFKGDNANWSRFLDAMAVEMGKQKAKRGAGLRILTETTTSPTLTALMKQLLTEYSEARWHVYDAAGGNNARMGSQIAFGQMLNSVYKFDAADVVLALDADFLVEGPGHVRYARDFINRRRLVDGKTEMNRLYAVESTYTRTGAKADHRIPLKASEVEAFARAVAAAVGVAGASSGASGNVSGEAAKFAETVGKDLKAHNGKALVVAGQHQSPAVHALAHAINSAIGAIGATVVLTDSLEGNPVDNVESLKTLTGELNAGKVEALFIVGANPVFTAPADLKFADALQKAALRVHLGSHNDETAELCQWHIPESHYLEAWSDARAFDGTLTVMQPLVNPLYNSKSAIELVTGLLGQGMRSAQDAVKATWREQLGVDFDNKWKQVLHDGLLPGALPAKAVTLAGDWASKLPPAQAAAKTELVFRLDPNVLDGRYANNGWLQELPKPLHKVTWDNYAIISPKTAAAMGVALDAEWDALNAKLINLRHGTQVLEEIAVWVQPGHPDDSITVYLGYGRKRAGSVGTKLGFDTGSLRTSDALWVATNNVSFAAVKGSYALSTTQDHFSIDTSGVPNVIGEAQGDLQVRQIVRTTDLESYKKDPKSLHHGAHNPGKELTIYPGFSYENKDQKGELQYKWGMAIDMGACTGCNACVVACQSENNIAVVGKDLVGKGRIMHWLRIDTYFKGNEVNPEVYFQPMLCQMCESAPCEVVCPVNATVHDAEGLNVQVYNRCVGTRYCANNCPYKVRRFNYLLYGDWDSPSLKNVRNPEVTIRTRGVMEKCTFCSQRIMHGKIEAEKQGHRVQDGEIQTACQTACPTDAIIFGDLNDPNSRVNKLKHEPRNYEVLADLNTRPRTSYLAEIRNPHPDLQSGQKSGHGAAGEAKPHA